MLRWCPCPSRQQRYVLLAGATAAAVALGLARLHQEMQRHCPSIPGSFISFSLARTIRKMRTLAYCARFVRFALTATIRSVKKCVKTKRWNSLAVFLFCLFVHSMMITHDLTTSLRCYNACDTLIFTNGRFRDEGTHTASVHTSFLGLFFSLFALISLISLVLFSHHVFLFNPPFALTTLS
jgi:hypothetical protein